MDERKNPAISPPAGSKPWNVDQSTVIKKSWQARQDGDLSVFAPSLVHLDPYVGGAKENSTILPVCYTELDYSRSTWHGYRGIPCNRGNMYGNETLLVAHAASGGWSGQNWRQMYEDLEYCLDAHEPSAHAHPAAFLLNMCRVFYTVLAPPGSGSKQGMLPERCFQIPLGLIDRLTDFA